MSDYLYLAYYYTKWKVQEFLKEKDIFSNRPMLKSSMTASAIIMAYIYFAKVGGPSFMSYRPPFYLREPIICYNFMMSFLNLALFLSFGRYGWLEKFKIDHNLVNSANSPISLRMTQLNYIFYLLKFIQFSDTIFLILLKMNNDISPFHILHRSLIPFLHWFGMNCVPGQQNNIFSLINTLLHTVMYIYYGMKMVKNKDKKSLQFENIIKKIQTIEFITIIAHGALLYLRNTRAMQKYLSHNFLPASMMLILFINLIIDKYAKRFRRRKSVVIMEAISDEEQSEKATKKLNK